MTAFKMVSLPFIRPDVRSGEFDSDFFRDNVVRLLDDNKYAELLECFNDPFFEACIKESMATTYPEPFDYFRSVLSLLFLKLTVEKDNGSRELLKTLCKRVLECCDFYDLDPEVSGEYVFQFLEGQHLFRLEQLNIDAVSTRFKRELVATGFSGLMAAQVDKDLRDVFTVTPEIADRCFRMAWSNHDFSLAGFVFSYLEDEYSFDFIEGWAQFKLLFSMPRPEAVGFIQTIKQLRGNGVKVANCQCVLDIFSTYLPKLYSGLDSYDDVFSVSFGADSANSVADLVLEENRAMQLLFYYNEAVSNSAATDIDASIRSSNRLCPRVTAELIRACVGYSVDDWSNAFRMACVMGLADAALWCLENNAYPLERVRVDSDMPEEYALEILFRSRPQDRYMKALMAHVQTWYFKLQIDTMDDGIDKMRLQDFKTTFLDDDVRRLYYMWLNAGALDHTLLPFDLPEDDGDMPGLKQALTQLYGSDVSFSEEISGRYGLEAILQTPRAFYSPDTASVDSVALADARHMFLTPYVSSTPAGFNVGSGLIFSTPAARPVCLASVSSLRRSVLMHSARRVQASSLTLPDSDDVLGRRNLFGTYLPTPADSPAPPSHRSRLSGGISGFSSLASSPDSYYGGAGTPASVTGSNSPMFRAAVQPSLLGIPVPPSRQSLGAPASMDGSFPPSPASAVLESLPIVRSAFVRRQETMRKVSVSSPARVLVARYVQASPVMKVLDGWVESLRSGGVSLGQVAVSDGVEAASNVGDGPEPVALGLEPRHITSSVSAVVAAASDGSDSHSSALQEPSNSLLAPQRSGWGRLFRGVLRPVLGLRRFFRTGPVIATHCSTSSFREVGEVNFTIPGIGYSDFFYDQGSSSWGGLFSGNSDDAFSEPLASFYITSGYEGCGDLPSDYYFYPQLGLCMVPFVVEGDSLPAFYEGVRSTLFTMLRSPSDRVDQGADRFLFADTDMGIRLERDVYLPVTEKAGQYYYWLRALNTLNDRHCILAKSYTIFGVPFVGVPVSADTQRVVVGLSTLPGPVEHISSIL